MPTETVEIWDCGHTGPGAAYDAAGRSYCYACCADRDRAAMVATGRAVLYLVGYRITNWPGSLEFAAWGKKTAEHAGGFGAQRTDAWFDGPDGFIWHAVNRGDNLIARCKRTKRRAA